MSKLSNLYLVRDALSRTRSKFVALAPRVLLLGLGFCVAGAIHAAHAQLIQQDFPTDIPGYQANFDASVINRMILQGQADGVQAGSFIVRPQLSESGGYNSNTLGRSGAGTGSGEVLTQAGLNANSDWPSDNFGTSVNVQDFRYTSIPKASYTNFTAGAGGSFQLGNDLLTLGYSHLGQHLTVNDLGQTGVLLPVPLSVDDGRLAYEKVFGHFSLTPSLAYDRFQFGKSDASINFTSLNHQAETEKLAWRYDFAPGEGVIGIFKSAQAQYGNFSGNDYFDAAAFVGLDYTPVAIFQWRALGGFETRRFHAAGAKAINAPVFELDAIWLPTDLDTITASAIRQLADPASAFGRSQTVTEVHAEADHQLRTNVFVNADGGFGRSLTESGIAGIGNGTGTQYLFGTAIWWNVNRHFSVKLSYDFFNNKTTGGLTAVTIPSNSNGFTRHTILLAMRLYD